MDEKIILIITVCITSGIGSFVRIMHEVNDTTLLPITIKKILLIVSCAIATGYSCLYVAENFGLKYMVGVPALVLAVGAIEITKALRKIGGVLEEVIKASPEVIISATRRFFNLPERKKKKQSIKYL